MQGNFAPGERRPDTQRQAPTQEVRVNNISKLEQERAARKPNISGQGMDRRIERKPSPWKRFRWIAAIVVATVLAYLLVQMLGQGRSLSVNSGRIEISSVTEGTFEDFIPLRGRLEPRSTVYLDAIEGGRVEEILVEDGALVRKGDLIVRLSNTNMQLEVLGREAAVTEQLNNMRTIELQLEQNRLAHKRNLVEIDYQIVRLNRQLARQRELVASNLISEADFDATGDELNYYRKRREVTLESQATDARMQEQQLAQLRQANDQLEASLAFARNNLDGLNIRAPLDGKLSGFNIEIGQSIEPGGRLGQVDDPDGYKLKVKIDEYYLGRVDLGQVANSENSRQDYSLRVSKIYPQVNNGQFEVDMLFDEMPSGLRRGQTMQIKLTLGDPAPARMIPNGAYYQETGGNWIFVVSPDGSEAIRRNVVLGRRNTDFIEVLDGLDVGEKVVTSPYTSYVGMDRLSLGAN
jgi:HlyD family secretion protein